MDNANIIDKMDIANGKKTKNRHSNLVLGIFTGIPFQLKDFKTLILKLG